MLSRRNLVLGVGALALAAPNTTPSQAEAMCTPWNADGVRQCTVGLAVPLETARQEGTEWCWAACVSAVFQFHGRTVAQARIVERLFGAAVNAGASGHQVADTIRGRWQEDNGRAFDAGAEVLWDTQNSFGRPDSAAQAANELAAGNPLIVGALGHATVLTAMSYYVDISGRYQVAALTIRDPWPGRPNRRSLSPEEALATNFLTKVEVF